MNATAGLVLILYFAVTAWSLRSGDKALAQFGGMWGTTPWGKQLFIDFYGLVAILALWMFQDASSNGGNWTLAIVCIATMPLLGAGSAAAYWLLR